MAPVNNNGMVARKAKKQEISQFKAEVNEEVAFLKGFPVENDLARDEAKKARDKRQKDLRAEMLTHKGPTLTSDEARETERKRKDVLRIKFRRASTRRSKIRREAKQLYQAWANPILVNKAKDADAEIVELDLEQLELKDSIELAMENLNKVREKHATMTGNGGTGSRPGTSASARGAQ